MSRPVNAATPAHNRKVDPARLRELWTAGELAADICRVLGVNRASLKKWRRALGLPPRPRNQTHRPSTRAKLAASYRRTLDRAGVAHLRATNPDPYWGRAAELATAYGLPADLRPVQVRVLLALAAGPLTTAELAAAAGRRVQPNIHHAFNAPRVPGGNYLTDLRHRGLVAYLPQSRGAGRGSGRGAGLYMLTANAMDLLTTRTQESTDAGRV